MIVIRIRILNTSYKGSLIKGVIIAPKSKRVKMRTPVADAPIDAMVLTSVHRTPPLRFPSIISPSGGRFPTRRRLSEVLVPPRVAKAPEQQTDGVRDEITVVESRPKLIASDESDELLRIRHSVRNHNPCSSLYFVSI